MPQKPRLLLVVTLAEAGGAQTYAAQLIAGLRDRFELTVSAYGPGPLRDAAAAAGVPFVPLRHVRRPVRPWRDLLGLVELIRLCRRVRPDIVHANSSKAGALAMLAGSVTGVRARVFTAHGWAFRWHAGFSARLYLWLERLTGRLATHVVCVSQSERAAGLEAGTCSDAKTVVIPNAVDTSASVPARGDHDNRVPVIVSVTRLKAPKDAPTLLRGLARLNGTAHHTRIVGDGPERQAVEAELRRLGLEQAVELVGERRDIRTLLAAADVFVLSSRSEGMPVSILEAMAAGLPIVASDVGGVPELVVEGETGLLTAPADDAALAGALARLLADPDLRRGMGAAGRARVEALFDLPRFHRAHLRLYEEALGAMRLGSSAP